MNNIEAAQKLEDQIMSVMNTAVEGKILTEGMYGEIAKIQSGFSY